MKLTYKKLICTFLAMQASACMTAAPVGAEVCPAAKESVCVLTADKPVIQGELVMLAAEESEKDKKSEHKSTLKEQTKSKWQIFACLGGGVLVVIAVISLLADKKKK